MQDKLISVIVLCYNPEYDKLIKTVNSIINQKNVNYEIIIADDGSKVEYKQELVNYFNSVKIDKVKYCFSEKNVGTIKNILAGVEASAGEIIKLISPGDYFFDECSLEKYLKAFEDNNADLVFGRAQYYTPTGELLNYSAPRNQLPFSNLFIKRTIMYYHDYILGASIACKKELFNYLHEIKEKVKFVEDVPLTFFSLADGKKIVGVNDYLMWYECGLGVSTNPYASERLKGDFDNFFEYFQNKYKKKARLSIRYREILNKTKNSNKVVKLIKRTFVSPFLLVYKMINKIIGKRPRNNSINGMDKITTLLCSEKVV